MLTHRLKQGRLPRGRRLGQGDSIDIQDPPHGFQPSRPQPWLQVQGFRDETGEPVSLTKIWNLGPSRGRGGGGAGVQGTGDALELQEPALHTGTFLSALA